MMTRRYRFTQHSWFMALPVVLSLVGCSSRNEPSAACVPGDSLMCAGPGGCAGRQVCDVDGEAFSLCSCAVGGDASTRDASSDAAVRDGSSRDSTVTDSNASDTGADGSEHDSGDSGFGDSGEDSADSASSPGPEAGDTGVDSIAPADASQEAGSCTPNTQRCSGNGIETCDSSGQWGDAWPCSTGTCSSGACTGSTSTGLSCAPGGAGMTNCGASSESCCASLEVAGGTYFRTYDLSDAGNFETAADGGPTAEADPAAVSSFRLDKYLVTVGRFRQFVNAVMPTDAGPTGYTPPAGSGKHVHLNGGQGLANSGSPGTFEPGWVASDDSNIAPTDANLSGVVPSVPGTRCYVGAIDLDADLATWTPSATTQENLPIDCVNWWEAYSFCIWDGGFLPSEAEWEYVAAGGSEQREYPWGSADPGSGNQYAIYDCYYHGVNGPPNNPSLCMGIQNVAPVGTATLGAALWGQLDIVGEDFEWNLDWYAPYVDPCADCAYLQTPSPEALPTANRVLRYGLMAPIRGEALPSTRYDAYGFRCARTP